MSGIFIKWNLRGGEAAGWVAAVAAASHFRRSLRGRNHVHCGELLATQGNFIQEKWTVGLFEECREVVFGTRAKKLKKEQPCTDIELQKYSKVMQLTYFFGIM